MLFSEDCIAFISEESRDETMSLVKDYSKNSIQLIGNYFSVFSFASVLTEIISRVVVKTTK